MRGEATRFALGVTFGVLTSVALPMGLVPHLLGLVHIGEWLLSMTVVGTLGVVGVGLWSYRRVRWTDSRGGARRSIHDIPFALAQAVLGFAIAVGALTILVLWAVGHRVGLATSAGVVAYLLSALPVLGVYLFSRRRLAVLAVGDDLRSPLRTDAMGRRQSLRLRVLLAFQLPLVVSATGIVLVEHSDKTAYHQAVSVYHQDRRLRTKCRRCCSTRQPLWRSCLDASQAGAIL